MKRYIQLLALFFIVLINNDLTAQERKIEINQNNLFPQDSLSTKLDMLQPQQKLRLDIVKLLGRTSLIVFGAVTTRYSSEGIPSLLANRNPITLAEAQWGFTAELGRVLASLHLGRFGWELFTPQNPSEKLSNRPYTNDVSFGYVIWEHQGFSIAPCLISGETWRSLAQDPQKYTYLNSLGGEVNVSYTFPLAPINMPGALPEIKDMVDAMIGVRIGYAQHFTSDNSGIFFAPFAIPAHHEFSIRLVLGIGFSTVFLGAR